MSVSPVTIAKIAEQEFRQRTAKLRQAVDSGDWPGDPANEKARMWLAIAAAAGARLPELQVPCIFPIDRTGTITANNIAEPHAYLAELARARDVAIRALEKRPQDLRLEQRARDLMALADALGAPGFDHSTVAQRDAA